MSLRELTAEQDAILAQVESGDFTLDQVEDHLDMLKEDRWKKIESYLHVINRLESEALPVTAEIERLQAIQKQKLEAVQNTKDWLLMSLKDGEKHDFSLFKVSRVKGREVVNVVDQTKIPPRFITVKETVSINKTELLKDLKGGINVTGAEITRSKPSLRIK